MTPLSRNFFSPSRQICRKRSVQVGSTMGCLHFGRTRGCRQKLDLSMNSDPTAPMRGCVTRSVDVRGSPTMTWPADALHCRWVSCPGKILGNVANSASPWKSFGIRHQSRVACELGTEKGQDGPAGASARPRCSSAAPDDWTGASMTQITLVLVNIW